MTDKSQADCAPGTFGCHEALHMVNYLGCAVSEEICDHPAIKANPEWAEMAKQASHILFDLYQKIGAVHL